MKTLTLFLAFSVTVSASVIYTAADLGGLVGYSVANNGTVVGWAETTAGAQAFVASPGASPQTLSLPAATESLAYGVNASGTVVGDSYINGQAHGTIWSGSTATDLGAGVYLTGINDAGQIIGSNGHAFVYQNGQYLDLGALPGANWSSAYGINASGTVVGDAMTASGTFRGMIWTTQGATELGTLGGASSQANGINNSGEVVGFASLASGYQHAFSDINGTMTDLGTLGGGSSYAYGVNNSGEIVGYSWIAGNTDTHAFLYMDGQMLDLNTLLVAGSGWDLQMAYGINDQGQITGEGLFNGVPSAFLLTDPPAGGTAGISPVPEPGTLPVLLLGALVFLRRRTP